MATIKDMMDNLGTPEAFEAREKEYQRKKEAKAGHKATERFIAAATSGPPTDEQKENVQILQNQVHRLATLIELYVPEGRNKSIALTALEDVHMRANRGIFQDGVEEIQKPEPVTVSDKKEAYLKYFREGLPLDQIATRVGISRNAVIQWRAKDLEFDSKLERASVTRLFKSKG